MKFTINNDDLTIRMEGWEKVWALKSQLHVPRRSILEVDYLAQRPVMRDFRGHRRRIPGVSLPSAFLAGSYEQEGEREFWYVRTKTPGVLILTIKPEALPYGKIRLTCSPELAQDIADWWREK